MRLILTSALFLLLSGCASLGPHGTIEPLPKDQGVDIPTLLRSKELELLVMWDAGLLPGVGLVTQAEREGAAQRIESALKAQGFDFFEALHSSLVAELSARGLNARAINRDVKGKLVPTFGSITELGSREGAPLVLDVKVDWYGFYAATGGADYLPAVAMTYRLVDVEKRVELWRRLFRYNWDGGSTFSPIILQEKPLKNWPNRGALVDDAAGARAELENTVKSVARAIADQIVPP